MTNISISSIINNIEKYAHIPTGIDYSESPPRTVLSFSDDPVVLTCGCVIASTLEKQLRSQSKTFGCPVCSNEDSELLRSCEPLRSILEYIQVLKDDLEKNSLDLSDSVLRNRDEPTGNGSSLLTVFHEVLNEVGDTFKPDQIATSNEYKKSVEDRMSSIKIFDESSDHLGVSAVTMLSTGSSSDILQRQKTKTSFQGSNITKLLSSSPTLEKQNRRAKELKTNKELLFSKNFPHYRKLYQHHTHHSSFPFKSKLFINTALSPDLTKFVLLSEKKWEVYEISPSMPHKSPVLYCCGNSNGDYGSDFDSLIRVSRAEVIASSNFSESVNESMDLLTNWEHLSCKITERLLVISGTRGFVRIIDLSSKGKHLFTYQSRFPIRCIDVSPDERFVSLGVTGKGKLAGSEQAFIILLRLQFTENSFKGYTLQHDSLSKTNEFEKTSKTSQSASLLGSIQQDISFNPSIHFKLSSFPFTLPYRDPITVLQFSPNSQYLSVATALESRFMVISVSDPSRPVLVMKSQRKLDTSLESEGITDLQFFPDNRLMTLTSVSYNSVPIIIDTKITSISGPEGIANPRLLSKLDDVGHTIHKCCVSPRGDSIAYLDRSGTVYLMTTPRMDDNDNKRLVIVTDVSNAYRVKESASMRFDREGYKLYILDRKGVLTISDFTAGTVEDPSITRCKIVT
ncbi:hypothetical protein OGAPHI_007044 [Ogataea philodendri]|uniref:SPS-sensor component PTR3 n=1 Tax=Ogataea philodendri TaxID=1378263 RepID=A0A9P8NU87_9ASCO|nr:uncharacterized protein OGAPHI_007044 [Ogataea philodendri]KAH3660458.1 hypothetical protein OGAPHI_007044 [Ogataea philodendri]